MGYKGLFSRVDVQERHPVTVRKVFTKLHA